MGPVLGGGDGGDEHGFLYSCYFLTSKVPRPRLCLYLCSFSSQEEKVTSERSNLGSISQSRSAWLLPTGTTCPDSKSSSFLHLAWRGLPQSTVAEDRQAATFWEVGCDLFGSHTEPHLTNHTISVMRRIFQPPSAISLFSFSICSQFSQGRKSETQAGHSQFKRYLFPISLLLI